MMVDLMLYRGNPIRSFPKLYSEIACYLQKVRNQLSLTLPRFSCPLFPPESLTLCIFLFVGGSPTVLLLTGCDCTGWSVAERPPREC